MSMTRWLAGLLILLMVSGVSAFQPPHKKHKTGEKSAASIILKQPALHEQLLVAVKEWNSGAIIRLLRDGADPNVTDILNERTLVHWAAERNDAKVLKAIIATDKADLNAQDAEGVTPLHIACATGKVEAAQELLNARNIDITRETKDGRNAFDITYEVFIQYILRTGTMIPGLITVIKLLQEKGAMFSYDKKPAESHHDDLFTPLYRLAASAVELPAAEVPSYLLDAISFLVSLGAHQSGDSRDIVNTIFTEENGTPHKLEQLITAGINPRLKSTMLNETMQETMLEAAYFEKPDIEWLLTMLEFDSDPQGTLSAGNNLLHDNNEKLAHLTCIASIEQANKKQFADTLKTIVRGTREKELKKFVDWVFRCAIIRQNKQAVLSLDTCLNALFAAIKNKLGTKSVKFAYGLENVNKFKKDSIDTHATSLDFQKNYPLHYRALQNYLEKEKQADIGPKALGKGKKLADVLIEFAE